MRTACPRCTTSSPRCAPATPRSPRGREIQSARMSQGPQDELAPPAAEFDDEPVPLFDPLDHLELHLRCFYGRLERHRYRRGLAEPDAAGRLFATERALAEL